MIRAVHVASNGLSALNPIPAVRQQKSPNYTKRNINAGSMLARAVGRDSKEAPAVTRKKMS